MVEFRMPVRFTAEDLNENGLVKASSIQLFFQTAAGRHATRAGIGFRELMDKNLIWVITRLRYELIGEPEADKDYTLISYPKPHRGVSYERDYYIQDEQGQNLVIGSSLWCILDFTTRKIARTGLDFEGEFNETPAFPDGFERLKTDAQTLGGQHTITMDDLDENEHTNNCRYGDMVCSVTGLSHIRSFSMSFTKESLLGDVLNLYHDETEEGHIVTAKLENGDVIFRAKVK